MNYISRNKGIDGGLIKSIFARKEFFELKIHMWAMLICQTPLARHKRQM